MGGGAEGGSESSCLLWEVGLGVGGLLEAVIWKVIDVWGVIGGVWRRY